MAAGEVSFDRVAHEYDETRGGVERARDAARDLARHLPDGDVLEIGVGTGIVARALLDAEDGAPRRLAGIDISERMLATAARRLPGRVVRASALRLPFPEKAFSGIIAVHVLHLVPDLTATLVEAARVLRTGGRVVAIHGEPEHDGDDELTLAMSGVRASRPARGDSPEAVRVAGRHAGLAVVSQVTTSTRRTDHTPAELADLVERRTWSFLWALDDEQWQAHAVPAIQALRALPDQDRPRSQVARIWVTALEKR